MPADHRDLLWLTFKHVNIYVSDQWKSHTNNERVKQPMESDWFLLQQVTLKCFDSLQHILPSWNKE